MRRIRDVLLLAAVAVAAGCAPPSGEEDEGVEGDESAFTGEPRAASLELVEEYQRLTR
jgi:hypothetical protein